MAKFVFRLQSVLNIKVRLEQQQRLSFAAANKKLLEEEEKLSVLYRRKEGYEDVAREDRGSTLVVSDIIETNNCISTMNTFIEDQKAVIEQCKDMVEKERIKLVEAMRERKTYERLREKAFEEFVQEENHAQSIENDEHSSFVYGTGRNEAI